MEEIARVYADALFEAAEDRGELDTIHEQLGQFVDALNESQDMRVFFFSPSRNSSRLVCARSWVKRFRIGART